jgi:rubrerythrin
LQYKKIEFITAFNKKRVYKNKNLDKTSTDALTLFLFEETYKEYELIVIYFYMQIKTNNKLLADVYQDLIDESKFHLKSFGIMLSEMGLLSIPRVVPKEVYEVVDTKQFILDGIEEERAAREECKMLAQAIKDEELSKFFDLINYQEDYHIKLMEKVCQYL